MRVGPARLITIVALFAGVSACASSGMSRPQPFPDAPPPPASMMPNAPAPVTPLDVQSILHTALALQGTPYEMGGDEPESGFDCSGFVRYVFELHHVDVPRTVAEQFHIGRKITLRDVRAGDLIFFSTVAPGASHVGIALAAAGLFVHAPGSGGSVRVEHYDTAYWQSRVVGARRVLPVSP